MVLLHAVPMRAYLLITLLAISKILFSQNDQRRPIYTALHFLDMNTIARIGGIGEIGVVSSSFYKDAGLVQNPALVSKHGNYVGGDISYTPILRSIVNDISLRSFSGYYSLGEKNKIGIVSKHFNMGTVEFRDENGNELGSHDMNEYLSQFTYSRVIKDNIALGIGGKYINSNMGYGGTTKPIHTCSFDLGLDYDKNYNLFKESELKLNFGATINNFGPKVGRSDSPNTEKEFIPTTLRLGLLLNPDFRLSESLRLNIDLAYQADKLLVPSPAKYSNDGNEPELLAGKDSDISSFRALYQSFYDAPDGFSEELHEIIHKVGSEVRLNYSDVLYFALRYGRFMEHETKGYRKYNTKGVGIGVYGFTLDYFMIGSRKSPINNNWAVTLGFRTNLDKAFSF